MKKLFIMMIALFAVAVVFSMVVRPSVKNSSGIFISGAETPAIPDSVMKIVKVSCLDCHSDGGNGMACSHVNFTKWASYDSDKQAAKANDICKIVTKGSMPPKRFRDNHPEAVLTTSQLATLCSWAKSFSK